MIRPISRRIALERLDAVKLDLKHRVAPYEHRAKNCATCETQGACCLDAHFVNVHISRLKAEAIRNALEHLPTELRDTIETRVDQTISKYALTIDGDTFDRKFACPLFEKSVGCLVHNAGKPVACIVHACYEKRADLPPDELQDAAERQIDDLNTRTYGGAQPWLPLPLAIRR